MSIAKKISVSVLLILGLAYSIEWIAQGAWVWHLTNKSHKEIEECLSLPQSQQSQCLIDSIENRNNHAILGVNGFLITIFGSFLTSGIILYRKRKEFREQRKKNAKCEC